MRPDGNKFQCCVKLCLIKRSFTTARALLWASIWTGRAAVRLAEDDRRAQAKLVGPRPGLFRAAGPSSETESLTQVLSDLVVVRP
jgi:hypothetical protein